MKTVVFVLQKSQFSAVIGNERCRFHGEESMSLSDSKPERIVGLFENNDDFKGWNDTKLFILYDSESKNYLSKIIEYFGKENKVLECEGFSFQIKLEENPVDFESGLPSFGTDDDAGDSVEIDKLKREIKQINAEIDRKNIENDELNREIVEKDNEISSLKEENENLKNKIAPKDKKIKELQKWYDDWDCYAVGNIISEEEGSILKLKKPIDTIHEIYIFSKDQIEYSKAELYLRKVLKNNWHFPTEKESEILFELCKIPKVFGRWSRPIRIFSLLFDHIDEWFIGDGKKSYQVLHSYDLVYDKNERIKINDGYKTSVLFVR